MSNVTFADFPTATSTSGADIFPLMQAGVTKGISFTNFQAYLLTNGTLVAPALGTPVSGVLTNCTVDGTNKIGYRGVPQNSQSAAYTTVLLDAGKCIFHPASDNNARTFTIDSNANVAFPIGTIIEFLNMSAASVTIAITSDTLTFLPAGTGGSRTLAQYGRASVEKISATAWIISGNGALT